LNLHRLSLLTVVASLLIATPLLPFETPAGPRPNNALALTGTAGALARQSNRFTQLEVELNNSDNGAFQEAGESARGPSKIGPGISQLPEQRDKQNFSVPAQPDVRSEFLHAWRGYKKYAWGHDDLKPLSKSYHDWYAEPLLMTPVDALDTMILMGLKEEAASTRRYIIKNLSFDKDISVQNFEITIRLLGGLLSSYQLTGDKRLLALAENLGNRLLPVFDSPTGLPYRFVNLKTGKVNGTKTNPAEAGTLLIEFGTLSKLTRRAVFYDKAKRALVEIYRRRSPIGLVGTWIDVETGKWTDTDSHISGAIDSYYEYLLKSWGLFGDEDCHRMWLDSIAAINKYLGRSV
jgi:hypothetical protein